MPLSPLAGRAAPSTLLLDVPRLLDAYYTVRPDPHVAAQRVAFGTSGHRGSAFDAAFNEDHILAISQAICLYRQSHNIQGPLFLGRDTHALSEPAHRTALEVLSANGIDTRIDEANGFCPTPVISHAILRFNRGRTDGFADGIVITPSHNPPEDGGFKYNPSHGGPAETAVTQWIERAANALLAEQNRDVKRSARSNSNAASVHRHDYVGPYVDDLANVVDLEAVHAAGIEIGVDPLGGASVGFWHAIAERHQLNLTSVNDRVDPTFAFMPVDHDGRIRMDCSSPYAMAGLVALKDRFDIAFGTDTDSDRHGIVVPSSGLMNPNHYLAVAISYLFAHRPDWRHSAAIGKTVVSSSLIDRVTAKAGRRLVEVPVGFKWFVRGLYDGSLAFGGEESAGASFLRRDGSVWTTDKDGLLLGLLAAEICAVTEHDPGELYKDITAELGDPVYARLDIPATPDQKPKLAALSPEQVKSETLADEKISAKFTVAPGNGEAIGGLKVVTENGWFAARPSGTENIYKIYAESFRGIDHLKRIQDEAKSIVEEALT